MSLFFSRSSHVNLSANLHQNRKRILPKSQCNYKVSIILQPKTNSKWKEKCLRQSNNKIEMFMMLYRFFCLSTFSGSLWAVNWILLLLYFLSSCWDCVRNMFLKESRAQIWFFSSVSLCGYPQADIVKRLIHRRLSEPGCAYGYDIVCPSTLHTAVDETWCHSCFILVREVLYLICLDIFAYISVLSLYSQLENAISLIKQ